MNACRQPATGIARVPNRGIALVITLTLMILLTVIAVGLLTLSSISLRASNQSRALATARQNARIALMLAFGELQKHAGPDQRITATADIAGTTNGLPLPADTPPRSTTNRRFPLAVPRCNLTSRRKKKGGTHASSVLPSASCAADLGHRCPLARPLFPAFSIFRTISKIAWLVWLSLLAAPLHAQQKDHVSMKIDDEWNVQENNVIPVRPNEQAQMIILTSDNSFFLPSDGSRSGFLQIITLRRSPDAP